MSRRRPLALSPWLLAAGCLLLPLPVTADEIEILELTPSPPATLDGIAPGSPIVATAENSVTAVIRYRLDGAAGDVQPFPHWGAGAATAGFGLVPPTSSVPPCGPIRGPSAGRCAAAFALHCSDRGPSTLSIERVGAVLSSTAGAVLATTSTAARYTFRCPGRPSRSSRCTVIGAAGAPGETPLPFGDELPICRCLRDEGAREFRCALLHPDFFAVRRLPSPLRAGQPFTEDWEFLALAKLDGPVKVSIEGAGLAKPVRHSLGVSGRKGKIERLKLEGKAPVNATSAPGAVDFSYEMKDADNDLLRRFRVEWTIEVVPGPPQ